MRPLYPTLPQGVQSRSRKMVECGGTLHILVALHLSCLVK
nr:MAG TPA: hypothetical protein [Caudoviricetes sp.]